MYIRCDMGRDDYITGEITEDGCMEISIYNRRRSGGQECFVVLSKSKVEEMIEYLKDNLKNISE